MVGLSHRLSLSCRLPGRGAEPVQREPLGGLCTPCLSFVWVFLRLSGSQAPMACGVTSRVFPQVLPPNLWVLKVAKRLGSRGDRTGAIAPWFLCRDWSSRAGLLDQTAQWALRAYVRSPTSPSPRTLALLAPAIQPLFLGLLTWGGRRWRGWEAKYVWLFNFQDSWKLKHSSI